MADSDLYAVLGVGIGAEPEVIDAAYRALARKYHPDVNHDPGAGERFRALNEAYRTLHDLDARARYDAELALRRQTPSPRAVPPRAADRPVDLFGAAVGDLWRRARSSARVQPAAAAAVPAARTRRRWALPALALGAGAVAGAAGASAISGRSGRAMRLYWSAAAFGRAAVIEARQPHEALAAGGFPAVAGNPSFASVATQLIAALEGATARLRAAGAIPPQAEAYHFLQLDDWREERELRAAQREAIQSRNPEIWAAAAEREHAWRTSPLHAKAEIAAAHIAALAARV